MPMTNKSKKLIEAVSAEQGIVCIVGAGGKKSMITRLAQQHPGRLAVTATVMIPPFWPELKITPVVACADKLQAEVLELSKSSVQRFAYAVPANKPGRNAGLEPATIERLHQDLGLDVSYIKADGARGRLIKAPGSAEPVLPKSTSTVLAMLSIHACGQVLDQRIAHHPELLAERVKVNLGEKLKPIHLARSFAHAQGALQHATNMRVIPVINMVDNEHFLDLARQVAEQLFLMTSHYPTVVLTALKQEQPLIDVLSI